MSVFILIYHTETGLSDHTETGQRNHAEHSKQNQDQSVLSLVTIHLSGIDFHSAGEKNYSFLHRGASTPNVDCRFRSFWAV